MQPARPQPRAPGSFSPLPQSNASSADLARPRVRRVESSSSEDSTPLNVAKARVQNPSASGTPIYTSFTSHANSSTNSLHNFSRPTPAISVNTAAALAARSVAASHDLPRNTSPLTLPPSSAISNSSAGKGHSRKHSQTAGLFDSTLPSTSTSNLSQIGMAQPSPVHQQPREVSASQAAAQAAVMHHQNQQQQQQQLHQQQQQYQQHLRQRSQTVPGPGETYEPSPAHHKRGSGGPLSPPMLSLTEASAPRESGFGNQGYHNGLLGSHTAAAAAAANVVFPRSGQTSPALPVQAPPPPPPPPMPEKKAEKSSKVKLFSRPGKIGVKGEAKDKPLPSPSKIGTALSALQRANFSTTSLDSTSQSFYNMANSSSATIRPIDTPTEKEGKEKKHHFLSRQKHKLKDKDDYHLPLSSASSNSRPTDPNAPSSLYNFNLPPSPGPNTTAFKSMSGLDLRHGGRALREKKKEDKGDNESTINMQSEWPGPGSVGSIPGSTIHLEPIDSTKYGLNSLSLDDAWPYLRAKLLVIFEGEDLRLPVEDFNRVVTMHIQFCIQRRSPNIIVEDLRDLLSTGFSSLDHTLRKTPEDRMIPALVELWLFMFTSILPYMQAVFLPLDLEFAGTGTLLTPEQARDFWGGVVASSGLTDTAASASSAGGISVSPAAAVLDVRRLVLTAYRDTVILPRYDTLKVIFSRLSLEFLPQSFASMALASPLPDHQLSTSPSAESTFSLQQRPGTAMSLDPSVASYNSSSTTLFGEGSGGSRSRAISNVSFASSSDHTNGGSLRPFTPSSLQALGSGVPTLTSGNSGLSASGSLREQNVEDSKQVTEMVGRMLQCMSVLASVGVTGDKSDEGNKKIEELSRLLKLNWLGRGRTGRNRRGIVGGRVRRGDQPPVREEVSVV